MMILMSIRRFFIVGAEVIAEAIAARNASARSNPGLSASE
jgi:hypothetical protein